MSQREESSSKSAGKDKSGKKAGKKAGKRSKTVPKKQSKRRSGQHSTDPSTPKAKLQDKLREAEDRQYRSSRTDKVVGAVVAPTKLDEVFDSLSQHKVWAIPLVVVAAIGTGAYAGVGTALLVLAGAFMLFVISSFWASVQSLTGEADLNLDEALSLAAPSAELEQKRATLRALKDLEFEHNIGKISDADYKDLSARYRADAKRLLQQLSDVESDSRKRAEELFNLKLLEMSGDVHLVDEGSRELLESVAPDKREKVEEVLVDAVLTYAKAKARGQTADGEADADPEDAEAEEAPQDADDEPADSESDEESEEEDDAEDTEDDAEDTEDDAEDTEDDAEPRADSDQGFVDDPVTSKQGVAGPSRLCKACKTRNILANNRCSGCNSLLAEPDQILCRACPATYPDSEPACPLCGVVDQGEH
ncbi:MAG: hypothetical protein AB7K71_08525 [Polyangiaceae bacterium]